MRCRRDERVLRVCARCVSYIVQRRFAIGVIMVADRSGRWDCQVTYPREERRQGPPRHPSRPPFAAAVRGRGRGERGERAMGLPPIHVLLEPRRTSCHALEWSRSDARRSTPLDWSWESTILHMHSSPAVPPQHRVSGVSRRHAARHVPNCVRSGRPQAATAHGKRRPLQPLQHAPLSQEDAHTMTKDCLQTLKETKRATRVLDALPRETMTPNIVTERIVATLISASAVERAPERRNQLPSLEERPSSAPASPTLILPSHAGPATPPSEPQVASRAPPRATRDDCRRARYRSIG